MANVSEAVHTTLCNATFLWLLAFNVIGTFNHPNGGVLHANH